MNATQFLFMALFITCTSGSLRADEAAQSAHAYKSRGDFCEEGASKQIQALESANKDKLDKIKAIKEEMSNLTNYDALLNEAKRIKNTYEDSLKSIAKSPAQPANDLSEKIGHVRSVIKNGMIIKSLTLLLEKQNARTNAPETLTMDDLCQNHKDDSICKSVSADDKKHLNLVLNAFQTNVDQLEANQEKTIATDIKKVFAEIPKAIAPDAMLEFLQKESPDIFALIKTSDLKDVVIKCLAKEGVENDEACKKVFSDHKPLIQKLTLQTKNLTEKMDKYNGALNVANAENKNDLQKALTNYQSSLGGVDKAKLAISEASKLLKNSAKVFDQVNMQEFTQMRAAQRTQNRVSSPDKKLSDDLLSLSTKKLSGTQWLFYSPMSSEQLKSANLDSANSEHAAKILKLEEEAMVRAAKDNDDFNNLCGFENTKPSDDEKNIERCKVLMDKIMPYVDVAMSKRNEKVAELSKRMNELLDDDFKAIENVKKYITERYLCTCKKDEKKDITVSVCNTGVKDVSFNRINGLAGDASIISDILYYNEIKIPKGSDCDLKAEDLADFRVSCSNSTVDSKFKSICAPILADLTARAQARKERKEKAEADRVERDRIWQRKSAENHYVYDRTAPGGYRAVKKQSVFSSMAIGGISIIPQMMYAGLGNMVMKNNISLLTTQGIEMKQWLHNVEYYNENNPWLNGFNYFGTLGIGTTSTTTTGTTSTTTTGTGFSF